MLLPTFEERYDYLRTGGAVGAETFGHERLLNQKLYSSGDWKRFRRDIIIRDGACDLADKDHKIPDGDQVIIHHINPITKEDIYNRDPAIFDPDNVICVSKKTHNIIHFGDKSQLPKGPIERSANDQCPWRH